MTRGLPDSWGTWAVRKGVRKTYRALTRTPLVPVAMTSRSRVGLNVTLKDVNIFEKRLQIFLNTSAGPLWWALERRAKSFEIRAKSQVGVRTGALRSSIKTNHRVAGYGQRLEIGSNLNYAYMHHQGTRPHIITASPGSNLKFVKNGQRIYTNQVNHPGTKPNPYLSSNLFVFARPIVVA